MAPHPARATPAIAWTAATQVRRPMSLPPSNGTEAIIPDLQREGSLPRVVATDRIPIEMTSSIPSRIRESILAVLFRHLSPSEWEVYLFGSFARGTAGVWSDVDLAVRGPAPLPAAKAARIVFDLESEVPILRDFDLVDLRRAASHLTRRILEEGISWNAP